MKKVTVMIAMLAGFSAFARGGDGGHGGLPLNSNAYLIHEATENSMRKLLLTEPGAAAQVSGVSASMIGADGTTTVTIELGAERVVKFLCTPFDDFSHGGTILKKEMACRAQ